MSVKYICKKCGMNVSIGINGNFIDLALHMEQNHNTKYTSLLDDKKFRYFNIVQDDSLSYEKDVYDF